MKQTFKRNLQKGFTLVELLIVVIILAILAAIVVPQFSANTAQAQLAAIDTNLGSMRSAIDLYTVQHNNVRPGVATSGAGAAGTERAFVDQLTLFTLPNGTVSATGGAGTLGPYLKQIPAEPVSTSSTVVVDTATAGLQVVTAGTPTVFLGTGAGGWKYATQTGQIIVNSPAIAPSVATRGDIR
jgi:prepilin-type N-terminal cleavage/methylation domain-containing protein